MKTRKSNSEKGVELKDGGCCSPVTVQAQSHQGPCCDPTDGLNSEQTDGGCC